MIVEHRDFFDQHWFKVFLNTFEDSIDSIVITSPSPEEHFLYVNQAFKMKTGYEESELLGQSPRILQGPLTNRKILDELKVKLSHEENFIGTNLNYRKDGTTYIVKWYISALRDEKSNIVGYVSYQKEITKSIEDMNRAKLFASIVDQVDQMIMITSSIGKIVYYNEAFSQKYGFSEKELIGKNVNTLKSGKMPRSFYNELWANLMQSKSFHGEFINKHKDGRLFFEAKTITPLKDTNGDNNFFVSIAQDITHLMQQKNRYKQKAYTDKLTGLSNRLHIDEVFEQKFHLFKDNSKAFSIILLDIDHFKQVNDTYGHERGDEVLQKLSKILVNNLRKDDLVARWGGEEFLVMLDVSIDEASITAEKLRQSVYDNLMIEGQNVTVSLGVSEVQEDDSKESLFRKVDSLLYMSKKEGRNRVSR